MVARGTLGKTLSCPNRNEDNAAMIARDRNVPASGVGYVTRFRVESEVLSRYPVWSCGCWTSSAPTSLA
ncbi:hypothetical protein IW248_005774 [Micromonospora ureilytica]|uniref:Uncharacterized protein n=1 Tax=Micromonospora ureilytica TaxID=709868 RepID=A0ABS0JS52_9ACTN|nr:hypothetical protein [Micromonospora ureilytica]